MGVLRAFLTLLAFVGYVDSQTATVIITVAAGGVTQEGFLLDYTVSLNALSNAIPNFDVTYMLVEPCVAEERLCAVPDRDFNSSLATGTIFNLNKTVPQFFSIQTYNNSRLTGPLVFEVLFSPSPPSGASIGTNLVDDKVKNTIGEGDIVILTPGASASAVEGVDKFFMMNVTSNVIIDTGLSFTYSTVESSPPSALQGYDYVAVTDGTATFTLGTTYALFNITIQNDNLQEGIETFEISYSEASASVLDSSGSVISLDEFVSFGANQSIATFLEEDENVVAEIIGGAAVEEDEGILSFSVRLSHGVATNVILNPVFDSDWAAKNPANRFPATVFDGATARDITFAASNHTVLNIDTKYNLTIYSDEMQDRWTQATPSDPASIFDPASIVATLRPDFDIDVANSVWKVRTGDPAYGYVYDQEDPVINITTEVTIERGAGNVGENAANVKALMDIPIRSIGQMVGVGMFWVDENHPSDTNSIATVATTQFLCSQEDADICWETNRLTGPATSSTVPSSANDGPANSVPFTQTFNEQTEGTVGFQYGASGADMNVFHGNETFVVSLISDGGESYGYDMSKLGVTPPSLSTNGTIIGNGLTLTVEVACLQGAVNVQCDTTTVAGQYGIFETDIAAVQFTLSLNLGISKAVVVPYLHTQGGVAVSGLVTFNPSLSPPSEKFTIVIDNDNVQDISTFFAVSIGEGTFGGDSMPISGLPDVKAIRVDDNEHLVIKFERASAISVPEGSALEYTVQLSHAVATGNVFEIPYALGGWFAMFGVLPESAVEPKFRSGNVSLTSTETKEILVPTQQNNVQDTIVCSEGSIEDNCVRSFFVNLVLTSIESSNFRNTFAIKIDAAEQALLPTSLAGMVTDNESPTFALTDCSGAEANANAVFNVTLSHPTQLHMRTNFTFADGTAVSTGSVPNGTLDYNNEELAIDVAPMSLAIMEPLTLINDNVQEADETYTVTVSTFFVVNSGSVTNIDVGFMSTTSTTATVTITDDEFPTVTVSNVTQLEDSSPFVFTVTLSHSVDPLLNLTVGVRTENSPLATNQGTGLAGQACAGKTNYVNTNEVIAFANFAQTHQVNVTVCNNGFVSLDKLFLLAVHTMSILSEVFTVNGPGLGIIEEVDTGYVSIFDAQAVPLAADQSGIMVFVVSVNKPIQDPFLIYFNASSSTTALPIQESFGMFRTPGTRVQMGESNDLTDFPQTTIAISVFNDGCQGKAGEIYKLVLELLRTSIPNIQLNTSHTEGTGPFVRDPGTTLSIQNESVVEGENFTFQFTLSTCLIDDLDTEFVVTDPSGATGTAIPATKIVTFPKHSFATQTIVLTTIRDVAVGADREVQVTLKATAFDQGDSNYRNIISAVGYGTILDDTNATVSIIPSQSGTEDAPSVLTFTVIVDPRVRQDFQIRWAVDLNTAASYLGAPAFSGRLDYTNGVLSQDTLEFMVQSLPPVSATFFVDISIDASAEMYHVALGNSRAIGYIQRPNLDMELSFISIPGYEGSTTNVGAVLNVYTTHEIKYTITPSVAEPADENAAYTEAIPGKDYSVTPVECTIPAMTAPGITIPCGVEAIHDFLNERNETFSVLLNTTNPNVTLAETTLVLTILDIDDVVVTVTDNSPVRRGNSLIWTVKLSRASSGLIGGDVHGLNTSTIDCPRTLGVECADVQLNFRFLPINQLLNSDIPLMQTTQISVVTRSTNFVYADETFSSRWDNLIRVSPSLALDSVISYSNAACNSDPCTSFVFSSTVGDPSRVVNLRVTKNPGDVEEGQEAVFYIAAEPQSGEYIFINATLTYPDLSPTDPEYGALATDVYLIIEPTVLFALYSVQTFVSNYTRHAVSMVLSITHVETAVQHIVAVPTNTIEILQSNDSPVNGSFYQGSETESFFYFNATIFRPTVEAMQIRWSTNQNLSTAVSTTIATVEGIFPDYATSEGTLMFSGQGPELFGVQVFNDNLVEEDKYFQVSFEVFSPPGFSGRFFSGNARGLLVDDEGLVIEVKDTFAREGQQLRFPVAFSHSFASSTALSAQFERVRPMDNILTNPITIPGSRLVNFANPCPIGGVGSCNFVVLTGKDEFVNVNRSIKCDLEVSDFKFMYDVMASKTTAVGSVLDDNIVSPTITVENVYGRETDGNFRFTLNFSACIAPGDELAIDIQTRQMTATDVFDEATASNVDYEAVKKTIIIDNPLGSTDCTSHVTFDVVVKNDDLQEYDEVFAVDFTTTESPYGSIATAYGHIWKDLECPQFDISDASVPMGTDSISFDITLSHTFQRKKVLMREAIFSPRVTIQTTPGSAKPDIDYIAQNIEQVFNFESTPGGYDYQFVVELTEAPNDFSEMFGVKLSNPEPISRFCAEPFINDQATGTISGLQEITLSLSADVAYESRGAAVVTATLNTAIDQNLEFQISVVGCSRHIYSCNGRATGRELQTRTVQEFTDAIIDFYQPVDDKVVILALSTSSLFSIPLHNDDVVEPDETMTVTVAPIGHALSLGIPVVEVIVTIRDDDFGTVEISNAQASETDSELRFPVSFSSLVEAHVHIISYFQPQLSTARPAIDFVSNRGNIERTFQTYFCNSLSIVIENYQPCFLELALMTNDIVDPTYRIVVQQIQSVVVGTATQAWGDRRRWPAVNPSVTLALTPTNVIFQGIINQQGENAKVSVKDQTTTEDVGVYNFPIYLTHQTTVTPVVSVKLTGITTPNTIQGFRLYQDWTVADSMCTPQGTNVMLCNVGIAYPHGVLPIDIVDDTISEKTEELLVELVRMVNYPDYFTIDPVQRSASLSVTDDDPCEVYMQGDITAEPGNNTLDFVIQLSHSVDIPIVLRFGFSECPTFDTPSCALGRSNNISYTSGDAVYFPDFSTAIDRVTVPENKRLIQFPVELFTNPVLKCDRVFHVVINSVLAPTGYKIIVGNTATSVGSLPASQEPISFVIQPASQIKSESDSEFQFTITPSLFTDRNFSVNLQSVDFRAALGRYTPDNQLLAFPANSRKEQSATITIIPNSYAQPTGIFNITVTSISVSPITPASVCSYNLGASISSAGFITDDDESLASVIEVVAYENQTDIVVPVQFSHTIANVINVSVHWSASIEPLSEQKGVVEFLPNRSPNQRQNMTVNSASDSCVTKTRRELISLNSIQSTPYPIENMVTQNGNLILLNTDIATIRSVGPVTQPQGGDYILQLFLDLCVEVPFSVQYDIVNYTAIPECLVAQTPSVLQFEAGKNQSQSGNILKTNCTPDEMDVQFEIKLTLIVEDYYREFLVIDAANGIIDGGYSRNTTTVSVGLTSRGAVLEGQASLFDLTFDEDINVKFDLNTEDGTANTADYVSLSTSIQLEASSGYSVSVSTLPDDLVEPTKSFFLKVSGFVFEEGFVGNFDACGGSDLQCSAEGFITSDDTATVSFSSSSIDTDSGSLLVFNLKLSNPVDSEVEVVLSTLVDSTAVLDVDYETVPPSAIFSASSLSTSFSVVTKSTTAVDVDKLLILNILSVSPLNLDLADAVTKSDPEQATGTILNPIAAQVGVQAVGIGEHGGSIQFRFTLSNPVAVAVTVTYSTAQLTISADNSVENFAVNNVDFTETSGSFTFDALAQDPHFIDVNLPAVGSIVTPQLTFGMEATGVSVASDYKVSLDATSATTAIVKVYGKPEWDIKCDPSMVVEGQQVSCLVNNAIPIRQVDLINIFVEVIPGTAILGTDFELPGSPMTKVFFSHVEFDCEGKSAECGVVIGTADPSSSFTIQTLVDQDALEDRRFSVKLASFDPTLPIFAPTNLDSISTVVTITNVFEPLTLRLANCLPPLFTVPTQNAVVMKIPGLFESENFESFVDVISVNLLSCVSGSGSFVFQVAGMSEAVTDSSKVTMTSQNLNWQLTATTKVLTVTVTDTEHPLSAGVSFTVTVTRELLNGNFFFLQNINGGGDTRFPNKFEFGQQYFGVNALKTQGCVTFVNGGIQQGDMDCCQPYTALENLENNGFPFYTTQPCHIQFPDGELNPAVMLTFQNYVPGNLLDNADTRRLRSWPSADIMCTGEVIDIDQYDTDCFSTFSPAVPTVNEISDMTVLYSADNSADNCFEFVVEAFGAGDTFNVEIVSDLPVSSPMVLSFDISSPYTNGDVILACFTGTPLSDTRTFLQANVFGTEPAGTRLSVSAGFYVTLVATTG